MPIILPDCILRIYSGSQLEDESTIPFPNPWGITLEREVPEKDQATNYQLMIQNETLPELPLSLGLRWQFSNQGNLKWVFMPAALYNGNRFPSYKTSYSPRYPVDWNNKNSSVLLSDVPRLHYQPSSSTAKSKVQLKAGDLAMPAMGFWDPESTTGTLISGPSHTTMGETMWEIEDFENTLRLSVYTPGVRDSRYVHMSMNNPSNDVPYRPSKTHEKIALKIHFQQFRAKTLGDFWDQYFHLWTDVAARHEIKPVILFEKSYQLICDKYNKSNWHAGWKLYLTVTDPKSAYPFQSGWCGGGIATYPLMASADPSTRRRAQRNIDQMTSQGMAESGLIFGKRNTDGWVSDFDKQNHNPHTLRWTLTRRQGDILYYLAKQINLRQYLDKKSLPKHHPWKKALAQISKALQKTFLREEEWGHFLDQQTAEVAIHGTCSGAIIPAGLILAGELLDDPAAIEIAADGAHYYYHYYTAKGVTNGGPGDALGNPDSESAAALVETYTLLLEKTGQKFWRTAALQATAQLASWVMPYNYQFPEYSEFGRLKLQTLGTVFANTQNKHSAPGICTHSGLALLNLFRQTGDQRPLRLLETIARSIPQYISRPDQSIHDPNGIPMPSGYINERVNTSDWDNNLGGIFNGSCWCEVSMLLTWLEIPSVYWQRDTHIIATMDHIIATPISDTHLNLHNPTPHPAKATIWSETSMQSTSPITIPTKIIHPTVDLPPGAKANWSPK